MNKEKLGTENIGKLLASLAIPAVVAQIVNLLYQDHNQSEIGRMIGVSQSVILRKIKRIAKKLEGDVV